MVSLIFLAASPWRIDSAWMTGSLGGAIFAIVALLFLGKVPLTYNLNNLIVRWKTTALTALAFMLVVGLTVFMLAFVNGMYAMTANSSIPGNVIILGAGQTEETFSNLDRSGVGEIENLEGIRRLNNQPMVSRETYIIVNQPVENPQPGRPERRFLQLRGIDDCTMSMAVHGLSLKEGAVFSSAGVREISSKDESQQGKQSAIEVVLGEGIAAELGNDRSSDEKARARDASTLTVGDSFRMNERTWLIVGITASKGSTYGSEVWAQRGLVGPMFGKQTYTSLVVRADASFRENQRRELHKKRVQRAKEVAEEATRQANEAALAAKKPNPKPIAPQPVPFPQSREEWAAEQLKEYLNNEFSLSAVNALTEKEYFANLNATNLQFLVAIQVVTVVLSVGGIFGVMNTMFAAISQRLRDIGVLRLMGFNMTHILVCFLLESLVLAMIGGLMGCGLGALSNGWTANSVVSGGQGGGAKFVSLQLVVDAGTLAIGMMLAIVMGLLGGLIPSISAIRMKPLDALR